ncbi:hypothetical protein [Halpernia frigidisoli]|uniref:Uncharacterized protein n=1 Tax=Halpernia frigidisoli TaxID=1125876 RepID=A0A1I3FMY7_9FLAO|nr:hypothetical protein [Halpernia frigidisoli]SFI12593.1 hypothetical protein SAMN05443292_1494 [Halpernia frigidisoli]
MKSKIYSYLHKNTNIMYKKSLLLLTLMIITGVNAQVIIGNSTGGAEADKSAVLLEFASGKNKGIIVPYVRILPTIANGLVGGTIVLDASLPALTPGTNSRVKFYAGADGWKDLSGQDANLVSTDPLKENYMASQPALSIIEGASTKAIIGDLPLLPSNADGVLVLNSTKKAMVLPIVADVQNITSPSPGMLVYVNKSGAKRLAVYNGSKWSFWKS